MSTTDRLRRPVLILATASMLAACTGATSTAPASDTGSPGQADRLGQARDRHADRRGSV